MPQQEPTRKMRMPPRKRQLQELRALTTRENLRTKADPAHLLPAGATEAGGGATGAAATDEKAKSGEASAEVAAIQSDLAAAKAQLQTAKADLDILQRKFNLDSQTYYGKPDYAADKEGAASIDAERGQVEAKQQEVADAQMKVDQLEAKLSNAR